MAGARVLVVQTNNATYGRNETRQQLAMARLRAVEHGRAVAGGLDQRHQRRHRARTVGLSPVPKIFTQKVLVDRVPLRDSLTLADRLGAGTRVGPARLVGVWARLRTGWTHGRRSRRRTT